MGQKSKKTLNENIEFAKNNMADTKDADVILSVNFSCASEVIAQEVLHIVTADKIYAEMNIPSHRKK